MARATVFAAAKRAGLALVLLNATSLTGMAEAQTPFARSLQDSVAAPETRYRPDVRWWLAEGLNTDVSLRKNVDEIADSGFGAFEFLAMPERSAGEKTYGWGSEEWTADSRLLIQEATKRGLGFSLTSGTHWATANLPDSFNWKGAKFDLDNRAASKELDYATIPLGPGASFNGELPRPAKAARFEAAKEYVLQGVVAAKVLKPRSGAGQGLAEGAGTGVLDFKSLTDLTSKIVKRGAGYQLRWQAPADGQYAIFVYWLHGTGQTASPSVSTNYAVNYIDSYGIQAMTDYWDSQVMTDELKQLVRANGRGEMYMDSLELTTAGAGGTLWGYHFKDEFKKRRGYDITPYLPIITMDRTRVESSGTKPMDYAVEGADEKVAVEKIRSDFYRTLTDMYLENALKPLQAWLHQQNMTLRAEPSYGTVMEISLPAKYIDGIETESFAQNADVDLFRGMLGSANMYGRPFSSETGAVLGKNYFYNMDYWTQLLYMQFVGGVNRTVLHGYSAIEGSEGDTYWPGHEGMYARFSERFNSRQPAAAQYPEWTRMIARNQKVLRNGRPQRDIAILRTDNFFVNYGVPPHYYPSENSYTMHDQSYFWRDQGLQQAGYTYDYFSAQLLEDADNVKWTAKALQPDGPAYKAIILYQSSLELSAAKKLLEIARGGLPVLFVNNTEEVISHGAPLVEHKIAASRSKFFGDSDAELARVVSELKQLPNVKEVGDESQAKSKLVEMGVIPRVAFERPNDKILTISRLDDSRRTNYTFAYSYKSKVDEKDAPYNVSMVIEGEGKPYLINDWTGEVTEVGAYTVGGGRTRIALTLKPGEARLIALDLGDNGAGLHALSTTAGVVRLRDGVVSVQAEETGRSQTQLSDGRTLVTDISVPDAIQLKQWSLSIEDWNAGEKVVNTETKFGHTTREVYFTTKKTPIQFANTELVAWKDLKPLPADLAKLDGPTPQMDQVSGIGTYSTQFALPTTWGPDVGASLELGSTNGSLATVVVNGQKAGSFNPRSPKIDISRLLRAGENTVEITVASTLTNRMLQRGYDKNGSGWATDRPAVQSYGITGGVRVVPYVVKAVQ